MSAPGKPKEDCGDGWMDAVPKNIELGADFGEAKHIFNNIFRIP